MRSTSACSRLVFKCFQLVSELSTSLDRVVEMSGLSAKSGSSSAMNSGAGTEVIVTKDHWYSSTDFL